MRPMMCLDSRGKMRNRRLGPVGACPVPETSFGLGFDGVPSMYVEVEDEQEVGCAGGMENNRKELSDCRGAFHGKRLKVIQQKMIASDQISAG